MIHCRTLSKVYAAAVVIGGIQFAGIVFSPSAQAQTIQASGSDTFQPLGPAVLLTAAQVAAQATGSSDGKSTKNVQTTQEAEASPWSVYFNGGYTSEYIFRGTNLMPNSDGGDFFTGNVSYKGFTFGVYGIHQFGSAHANAFSIGEGGGGGNISGTFTVPGNDNADAVTPQNPLGPNLFFTGTISPVTTQTRFNELDVYLSYTHDLGPLDITVGNIAFFIDRHAETRVTTRGTFVDGVRLPDGSLYDPNNDVAPPGGWEETVNQTVAVPTVQYETFDRIYVAVSAPRLFHSDKFNIVPKLYYYQTILNAGNDPGNGSQILLAHPTEKTPFLDPEDEIPEHNLFIKQVAERNTSLGGYLEARVDANFNVSQRITIQPYTLISYSFHDRTEPSNGPFVIVGQNSGQQKLAAREFFRASSLVGFNNFQAGVKVPILLWSRYPVMPRRLRSPLLRSARILITSLTRRSEPIATRCGAERSSS